MARIGKILGRTDDMLIVRGVNVFPSQIEHALLGVEELDPQYQIVLTTRADRQDELRVRVEAAAGHDAGPAERAALGARVREVLHSALGLAMVVEIVAAGGLPRSEGKALRIVDERRK
jgi:phenylacetate-CoA ligase